MTVESSILSIKLSAQELESLCINTVRSFDAQIQTIDPLDTERARLKLCGLQHQLRALKWDAKKMARQLADNPLEKDSVLPLQKFEQTMIDLAETIDNVEYEINKNDPNREEYSLYRAMKF